MIKMELTKPAQCACRTLCRAELARLPFAPLQEQSSGASSALQGAYCCARGGVRQDGEQIKAPWPSGAMRDQIERCSIAATLPSRSLRRLSRARRLLRTAMSSTLTIT